MMDIRTTFHNFEASELVHDDLHYSLSNANFADQLAEAEAVFVRRPDETEITCQLSLLMQSGFVVACSAASRDAAQAIKIAVKRAARLVAANSTGSLIPGIAPVTGRKSPPAPALFRAALSKTRASITR